jgi:hypothetical protein
MKGVRHHHRTEVADDLRAGVGSPASSIHSHASEAAIYVGLGFGELLVLLLLFGVVLLPAWRIVRRAGLSGAWALLLFDPLVNLVAVYAIAFTEWPVERRASVET